MRRSSRQAARAASKARLSGAILPHPPKNTKIAFADNDVDDDDGVGDIVSHTQSDKKSEENNPVDVAAENSVGNEDAEKSDTVDNEINIGDDAEDDVVEEVTGSAARASTQKSREVERQISKESTLKKKRRKKSDFIVENNASQVEYDDRVSEDASEDEDDEDMILTDDFFKTVDSERALHIQKMKQEKKHKKKHRQKLLGKHTTFVVEGDYGTDTPHPINSNIEVVALGEVGENGKSNETYVNNERQLLISATLGMAPSKAATSFARGSMACGTSTERGCNGSKKRKSKDDETWKRSRKMIRLGAGHRPGQAATLFVRKPK